MNISEWKNLVQSKINADPGSSDFIFFFTNINKWSYVSDVILQIKA